MVWLKFGGERDLVIVLGVFLLLNLVDTIQYSTIQTRIVL